MARKNTFGLCLWLMFWFVELSAQTHSQQVSTAQNCKNANTTYYSEDEGLSQWHVTQMLQDHKGMMWFSTWNGLNRFDGTGFVVFKSVPGDGCNMPTDRIRDMILAPNNDIYCLVEEQWYRFSQADGKFYNIPFKLNAKLFATTTRQAHHVNNSSGATFSLTDRQGNQWNIVNDGVQKITGLQPTAQSIPNVGSGQQIRAFFRDSKGRIWISNRDAETLYLFDASLRLLKQIHVGARVYCMNEDQHGNLLLGCKPQGLYVGNENGFKPYVFKNCGAKPLDIYHILHLGHNQWLLGTFQGLLVVNNGVLQLWHGKQALKHLKFRKLLRKGQVIVGATTNGLFVGDNKTGTYNLHLKEAHRANSLQSSACMDIIEHRGRLFVATESGGVNEVLNRHWLDKQLRFRYFNHTNGMPSDIALSLAPFGNELLVVSSNRLVLLNVNTSKARTLDKSFFQKACRFSEATPIRLNDGRRLFGLHDGAMAVNEAQMRGNRYKPYLALTSLAIENNPPQYPVDACNKIVLGTDERTLSIGFSALDYRAPQNIQYAYRYDNDTSWHYLGKNKLLLLAQLKPGRYTLWLQSTNAEGTWSGNQRKISIVVTPRFTETTLFVVLCVLAALLAVAAGTYTFIYIRNMRKQQRETLEAYLSLLAQTRQSAPTAPATPPTRISEQHEALMKRIVAFVETQMDNSDLSVGDMAEAVMMSKSGLTRKMKEIVGLTPADFVKEARIKRAAELLQCTDRNISEIAYACGFSDPKYFSRVFRATVGKSPSEYRDRPQQ